MFSMDYYNDQSTNIFLFSANGYSMWPFLKGREKLIVKRISLDNLATGDLILYRQEEKLVCHRLIKKAKDSQKWVLYVRGDNAMSSPEILSEEAFKGKVIGILDKNRMIRLDTFWTKSIGRMLIVFGPAIGRSVRFIKKLISWNR